MFNHDWFHGGGLRRQVEEAKRRCADKRFPDANQRQAGNGSTDYDRYREELETRTILYLKDGLSYEMRELADVGSSSALAFECTPVDENYQVGAYVVVVPFEDISRVEVFAVHPSEKPQENLKIPGFRVGGGEHRSSE
ncbi:hypothetical protein RAS1_29160 [Phycisphaerae bacterium RAS1]|nr:hypothetical protein RAS1_29160 [Phycisphaerae bacterium RAS1]